MPGGRGGSAVASKPAALTGITFVAAGANTTHAASGTQNVPVPAGMQVGDLMLGFTNSFSVDTLPTGWTDMFNGTAGANHFYRLCYRIFQAGDANMVANHAGFSLGCSIVYGFRGISTTLNGNSLPIDGPNASAAATASAQVSNVDITAPTVTTATANAKVYAIFTTFDDVCNAFTTASKGTEKDEQYGAWGGFLLVEQDAPTPGSVTGPASHGSGSGAVTSQLVWSLAFRP